MDRDNRSSQAPAYFPAACACTDCDWPITRQFNCWKLGHSGEGSRQGEEPKPGPTKKAEGSTEEMTFWKVRLQEEEAAVVRHILCDELYEMHRPEIADLLKAAEFAFSGRTLWIHPQPEEQSPVCETVLNLAALRAGLPIDAAYLYPQRYKTA
jgi:hypothetical protein